MTIWIVAANEHRARIFEMENGQSPLQEIQDFLNPDARLRNQDIDTDAKGRYYGKGERMIGHTAEPDISALQHKAELFSKSVCAYLEKARVEHRYDKLALIAYPKFLGLLRKNLGKGVQQLIETELPKDISGLEPRQIDEYLRTRLQIHRKASAASM